MTINMKRILTILAAMTIACGSVFAKYAPDLQNSATEEHSYSQDNYPAKIGKGVHMTDAGKALIFIKNVRGERSLTIGISWPNKVARTMHGRG